MKLDPNFHHLSPQQKESSFRYFLLTPSTFGEIISAHFTVNLAKVDSCLAVSGRMKIIRFIPWFSGFDSPNFPWNPTAAISYPVISKGTFKTSLNLAGSMLTLEGVYGSQTWHWSSPGEFPKFKTRFRSKHFRVPKSSCSSDSGTFARLVGFRCFSTHVAEDLHVSVCLNQCCHIFG